MITNKKSRWIKVQTQIKVWWAFGTSDKYLFKKYFQIDTTSFDSLYDDSNQQDYSNDHIDKTQTGTVQRSDKLALILLILDCVQLKFILSMLQIYPVKIWKCYQCIVQRLKCQIFSAIEFRWMRELFHRNCRHHHRHHYTWSNHLELLFFVHQHHHNRMDLSTGSRWFIRVHCGVAMEIWPNTKMRWASFGTRTYVVNNTTNVQPSSKRAVNSKAYEILHFLHDHIVIAIGNFIIVLNVQIRSFPIKSVTLISTFCDHNAFAKNIPSLDAENGTLEIQ